MRNQPDFINIPAVKEQAKSAIENLFDLNRACRVIDKHRLMLKRLNIPKNKKVSSMSRSQRKKVKAVSVAFNSEFDKIMVNAGRK